MKQKEMIHTVAAFSPVPAAPPVPGWLFIFTMEVPVIPAELLPPEILSPPIVVPEKTISNKSTEELRVNVLKNVILEVKLKEIKYNYVFVCLFLLLTVYLTDGGKSHFHTKNIRV
jgi:hypothetical protein